MAAARVVAELLMAAMVEGAEEGKTDGGVAKTVKGAGRVGRSKRARRVACWARGNTHSRRHSTARRRQLKRGCTLSTPRRCPTRSQIGHTDWSSSCSSNQASRHSLACSCSCCSPHRLARAQSNLD